MTALREWLLGVIGASLLLSLTVGLFPKGKFQSVGNFVAGLVLLLVMVRPLLALDIASWDDISAALTVQSGEAAQEEWETLSTVISEKTAAYIQDKASSLGVNCCAEVRCTEREGVPFPAEVWLDTAYHEGLSALIAADLAIGPDHQYWQGGAP